MLRTTTIAILLLALISGSAYGQSGDTCKADTWPDFERQLRAAQTRFQQGQPEPLLALWSHADDVTLMGALGGHERGWGLVGARLARIATSARDGSHDEDQVVSRVVGADVAVIVVLEHITRTNADGSVRSRNVLRVTHVARCEGAAWRLIHRHADPLVENTLPAK